MGCYDLGNRFRTPIPIRREPESGQRQVHYTEISVCGLLSDVSNAFIELELVQNWPECSVSTLRPDAGRNSDFGEQPNRSSFWEAAAPERQRQTGTSASLS